MSSAGLLLAAMLGEPAAASTTRPARAARPITRRCNLFIDPPCAPPRGAWQGRWVGSCLPARRAWMAILRERWRDYNEQRTRRSSARSAERGGGRRRRRPSLRAHDGFAALGAAHPVRHDRAARAAQGRHPRLGGRRRAAAARGRGGDPRPRRGVLDRGGRRARSGRGRRRGRERTRHPADGRRHGADGGRGARACSTPTSRRRWHAAASPTSRRSRSTPGRPGTSARPRTTAGGSSRCVAFVKPHPGDNEWAHPIDGVIAFVDLNRLEVLRVDDHGVVPIPPESGNFDVAAGAPLRDDIAPLEITQPDGPGFTLDGPRALVAALAGARRLHAARGAGAQPARLRATAGGCARSCIAPRSPRWSCPTATRARRHYWKNAFDAGENGVGVAASPLTRGCDCLGEIVYLDAVVSDAAGRRRCASRTRSASTRRTPACSGGTSSGATARARCAARGAS